MLLGTQLTRFSGTSNVPVWAVNEESSSGAADQSQLSSVNPKDETLEELLKVFATARPTFAIKGGERDFGNKDDWIDSSRDATNQCLYRESRLYPELDSQVEELVDGVVVLHGDADSFKQGILCTISIYFGFSAVLICEFHEHIELWEELHEYSLSKEVSNPFPARPFEHLNGRTCGTVTLGTFMICESIVSSK